MTVPCAPILRRTPGPSTLASAELHPKTYYYMNDNIPRKRYDHGFEEIGICDIFLSGASVCLRTRLRLLPLEIEQGSTRV